jgi:RimJ/RimL family protein N-acetyltransferase
MVDYLFLSKEIVRIQAETHPENVASHKVLEKQGLKGKEQFENPFSAEVHGETRFYSASLEKIGKNQRY